MTKTNKRLLTLLFAAFMAICAGFALLLARPASSASAEETTETPTYSETWVINEKWGKGNIDDWMIEGECFLGTFHSIFVKDNSFLGVMWYSSEDDIMQNIYISEKRSESEYIYVKRMVIEADSALMDDNSVSYTEWKDNGGKITFYEDTSAEKFSVLRTWLEANATLQTAEDPTPTKYTVTFNDGETALGTVEAEENAKLSALDLSAISTAKEGYTFKGWSLTNGGEVLDLDTVTVTGDITLYAVYEKNAEPTEPTDPTDPTDPENPNDPSFEDKVKDFGEKASTWIKDNIGITISGSAVIIIIIVAALVIVFKRK